MLAHRRDCPPLIGSYLRYTARAANVVATAALGPGRVAVAAQIGFIVPETLITNDPESANEFCSIDQRVVFKTLSSPISTFSETRRYKREHKEKFVGDNPNNVTAETTKHRHNAPLTPPAKRTIAAAHPPTLGRAPHGPAPSPFGAGSSLGDAARAISAPPCSRSSWRRPPRGPPCCRMLPSVIGAIGSSSPLIAAAQRSASWHQL